MDRITGKLTTGKYKDCKYKKYLDFNRDIAWRTIEVKI